MGSKLLQEMTKFLLAVQGRGGHHWVFSISLLGRSQARTRPNKHLAGVQLVTETSLFSKVIFHQRMTPYPFEAELDLLPHKKGQLPGGNELRTAMLSIDLKPTHFLMFKIRGRDGHLGVSVTSDSEMHSCCGCCSADSVLLALPLGSPTLMEPWAACVGAPRRRHQTVVLLSRGLPPSLAPQNLASCRTEHGPLLSRETFFPWCLQG